METENQENKFSLTGGNILFMAIMWLTMLGGWAFELIGNLPYGLGEIVSIIYAFFFIGTLFMLLILIGDILSILGFGKKDLVSTIVKQQPKNPVYQYTQSATKTALPQPTQDSTKRLSPSTSVSKDKFPSSIPAEKILPPENFFSVPRKIDWDELNKTRKYNGDLGEMFVYDLEKNYLTKIGRSDLAEKVHHVANEGDGHGYDIKSFYENGSAKYIEVKATNASSGSTLNISKNEFNFLQTHLNNAVVYHVHNVNNERETTVVIYPAGEVVNSPNISPSGYVVKM
jgi:hypothetical protein